VEYIPRNAVRQSMIAFDTLEYGTL
jgi:hypothetical protein